MTNCVSSWSENPTISTHHQSINKYEFQATVSQLPEMNIIAGDTSFGWEGKGRYGSFR